MISHTMLGTNNFEKAESFYSSIISAIGGTRIHTSNTVAFWQFEGGNTKFALAVPFKGGSAIFHR